MIIQESFQDLDTPTGKMRTHIFEPVMAGKFPVVMLFSEIYQMTGPIARTARYLACFGYVVAVPEVYHEFEPLGEVFEYSPEDSDKGNRYKLEKEITGWDQDTRTMIDFFKTYEKSNNVFGAVGICLGGHLSFRAAMEPEVKAATCFYATDIHKGTLGKGENDGTLARIPEINAELLMFWGKQDPHISGEGRALIYQELTAHDKNFQWVEFNGMHAFMRDEGHRYNAELSHVGLALMTDMFHRVLYVENQTKG